jgi:hypothetical protein
VEYATTVNDLLHIHTDLRSLFADDAVTAGFDKVGEGLTLSSTHFAAYQEAAENGCGDRPIGGIRVVCGIWCGEQVPCCGAVFARHSAVKAGTEDERRSVPGT